MERIQKWSLKIDGLVEDHAPTLAEKRDEAAIKGLNVIGKDPSHIFHTRVHEPIILDAVVLLNLCRSQAKNSFLPRATRL